MLKIYKLIAGMALLTAMEVILCPLQLSASELQYTQIRVIEKSETIPAPATSWVDSHGVRHSLREFRGKPVILHFWASWCPPCRKEFQELNAWSRDVAGAEGITLLALSGDDEFSSAERFMHEGGYQIPVRQTDEDTQMKWLVRAFPTTYFIDADGDIRGVIIGATAWDSHQLRSEIASLLGERSHAIAAF